MDAAPSVSSVEMGPGGDNDPQPKDANERTLGIVMHLIPLAGVALAFLAIPLGNVLAPLIFWLIKRHDSAYLDNVGKEVLNFQVYLGAVGLLGMIPILGCLLIPLFWAAFLASLVLMVMAAIAVSDGKFYRYPWIRRFIQ